MSRIVTGTVNATGSTLYIGIGFIPDWVKIRNLESAETAFVEWNLHLSRFAETEAGLHYYDASGILGAALTHGNGVAPYRGGDTFATAQTAYLVKDPNPDKRDAGSGADISTWTLDTPGSRTGKFNAGVNTTYVGEGSLVRIGSGSNALSSKTAAITSMTNDGDADDEVTLSEALGSGDVYFLGPMYDFTGVAANTIMPAGFSLAAVAHINDASGEAFMFEAGQYEIEGR